MGLIECLAIEWALLRIVLEFLSARGAPLHWRFSTLETVKTIKGGKAVLFPGTAFLERGNGDFGDRVTLRNAHKLVNTNLSNLAMPHSLSARAIAEAFLEISRGVGGGNGLANAVLAPLSPLL
jgi:hypothetical protein